MKLMAIASSVVMSAAADVASWPFSNNIQDFVTGGALFGRVSIFTTNSDEKQEIEQSYVPQGKQWLSC